MKHGCAARDKRLLQQARHVRKSFEFLWKIQALVAPQALQHGLPETDLLSGVLDVDELQKARNS